MIVCDTSRLRLRYLTPDDAPFMLELLNEPSFIANVADRGVRTPEDARAYIIEGPIASYARHGFGLYLVELVETGVPIGICGLLKRDHLDAPDVGFAFLPAYWSNGYARESAAAVMQLGREAFGLTRIVAITAPHNHASMRVLESLGLSCAGRVRLAVDGGESMLFTPDGRDGEVPSHA
jgi:RimJ/RimL family protein N-acetyltransferase